MKNLKIFFLLIGFQSLMFSQITPGRYIIKLDSNQKAMQLNGFEGFILKETCAPNTYCEYQYWDVKKVRNSDNLYYIQSVQRKKYMTYKLTPNGKGVLEFLYLETQKPLASMQTQSFLIEQHSAGKYFIKPSKSTKDMIIKLSVSEEELAKTEPYLQISSDETTPLNRSLFTFSPIQTTSSVQVTQVGQTVASPTVYVTPKSNNKLDIDFKTGGDNLDPKDFMEGVKITVKIKNKPNLIKENANDGREWPNNSIRRVTLDLPADINCQDIQEVIISRHTKGGMVNNITAIVGDNWNLNKVTVTSRIKVDGIMKTGTMNYMSPSGSNENLYRFVYEDLDDDKTTGKSLSLPINGLCPTQNNALNTSNSSSNASLNCVFGTGGDNLEGGSGNNVNIKLTFKSSTKTVSLNNINDTAKWNNFTENSVTKTIPNSADIDINDIKEVEIRHTGGGGMFADNWHVDKIKITITKNGQSKNLVDRIDAPIHMFTGDSRSKKFKVE